VDGAEDRHRFFEHLPARRKVDAVVIVAFPLDAAEHERLDLMGVTIVAAGGPDAAYPYVSIDDRLAGRQAVSHLLGLGHRRVAMIATVDPDPPEWITGSTRAQFYHDSVAAAGIEPDPRLVVTVEWGAAHGAQAMDRLLRLESPPTAVFAHSDEVAIGALHSLRRAGIRVPEDVSVVGIDDHPMSEFLDLTTVRQPVREQGALTAQMLLSLLRGEDVDRAVTVATQLVLRGSTAPPSRAGARLSRK
jgi:LacI family repressor for deo operon, udp, cdd, tsx, nupC, and nupG